MQKIVPVILAGGGGTRLWPRSREEYPKQFLPLISERSLLVETVLRTSEKNAFASPIVICNAQHRFHVADDFARSGITPQAILLEPCARNTAAAAATAALMAMEISGPDTVVALLPADHFITDGAALCEALILSADAAGDRIVTLGIHPTRADTGYGYIEMGPSLHAPKGGHAVARFIEKPDMATAERLAASGQFLWNAGIFVARAGLLIDEITRHAPQVAAAARRALADAKRDLDFIRLDEAAFSSAPSISLDYAVMEKTDRAAVLPVSLQWSDVGNWYALWQADEKDASGNVEHGDILSIDCRNSFIESEVGLVTAIGLENILIVQTRDATLVAPIERSHEVREIVQRLKADSRREAVWHPVVRRPWGSFESLHNGSRHQVKHLVVKPGAAISLQLHHRRAEHWVVVTGQARVTIDDAVHMLGPNQTAHIPLAARHRLENPGTEDLHVIEVQCGDYLGEDDIVRFEDKYNRV